MTFANRCFLAALAFLGLSLGSWFGHFPTRFFPDSPRYVWLHTYNLLIGAGGVGTAVLSFFEPTLRAGAILVRIALILTNLLMAGGFIWLFMWLPFAP